MRIPKLVRHLDSLMNCIKQMHRSAVLIDHFHPKFTTFIHLRPAVLHGWALVLEMACLLFGVNPLSELMLPYHMKMTLWSKSWWIQNKKKRKLTAGKCFWKYHLWNDAVPASKCLVRVSFMVFKTKNSISDHDSCGKIHRNTCLMKSEAVIKLPCHAHCV